MENSIITDDLNELTEALVFLRYLELGGSEEDTDETGVAYEVLSDNVFNIAENCTPADMRYQLNNKVLADKNDDQIKQKTFDKLSTDFADIINLFKNYLITKDISLLQTKYSEMLNNRYTP